MKELTCFTLSVLQELEDEGRFGTAHVYRSTLRTFIVYWHEHHAGRTIPMKAVFTPASLKDFERHMQERMLRMNTISTYMRMLRAIYYRALKKGFVLYVPGLFDHVYTGTRADTKRALPPADMGQLLNVKPTKEHKLAEAQIWFALLFLLRGMPFADLARLRKCDLQEGIITYRRQKTGRPLTVRLTPQAAELIRSCADCRPESPYLLNILWDDNKSNHAPIGSLEEYHRYQNVLRNFNWRLKKLAITLGIPTRISSYAARHTWATIAYHKKCAVGIISNALGHSSVKVTETYLKPFDNDELDKTNRMIIAYTKKHIFI
ncbi:phage integrase SAM-like domain-containing protein [Bacteroides sp.]|uniref:tyrosine-type recombinase/integrase n=1 Tax=Bacteroides sp. TaxID=29523 RepID=UPI00262E75EB|nr:phage integrase SAM-like domain-containing protein [Bacteroides sp.]